MTSPGDALAAAQRLLATVSPVALALLTDDELGTHLVDVERVGKLVDALRIAAAGELADRSRRSLGAEGLAHRNGCSRPGVPSRAHHGCLAGGGGATHPGRV